MIEVTPMDTIPSGNPFHHDALRMGWTIGTNVTVMFEHFDSERQAYVVIVNTETGERIRVTFDHFNYDLG